jgi:very-short-patch-repair endonuclease
MAKPRRIRTSAAVQDAAKDLRKDMTPAEKLLWEHLFNRQLGGFKFRRQHPLGRFIADFYCAEARLVVEIDGGIHKVQSEQDEQRTQLLKDEGYRVIRFSNSDVENNLSEVLGAIQNACCQGKMSNDYQAEC